MYYVFFGLLISKCFAVERKKKLCRSLGDGGFFMRTCYKGFSAKAVKMAPGFEILTSNHVNYGGATSLILPYLLHLF